MRTIGEIEITARFERLAERDRVAASQLLDKLRGILEAEQAKIDPGQHCTSDECPYTMSHTAGYCGYPQPRRCECAFDYPKGK
jgi:hypothetical protein